MFLDEIPDDVCKEIYTDLLKRQTLEALELMMEIILKNLSST